MFGLGMSEIIFLAILALIVIGPKELPQVARTLGRFLNELKRSSNMLSDEIKEHTRFDEFNLDAPLSRSRKPKDPAKEEQAKVEPQQMEFGDGPVAESEDDSKKDEHKPS